MAETNLKVTLLTHTPDIEKTCAIAARTCYSAMHADELTAWADEKDTGSSDVQVAVLTKRIEHLTEHLKTNAHDHNSRRGLIMMVNRRRKLLDYLKRTDEPRYLALVKELGLRR